MSGLGRFLEFSVLAPEILDSLGYYKLLGFSEQTIGDTWSHKYAVLSDGVLCIGLHDREFDSPSISFVQQDLGKHARAMSDHGFDFTVMHLDEDVFNELGLSDRDGNHVTMLEARTFSNTDEYGNDSVLGTWFELSLPVRDAVRSARFWGSLAPTVLRVREEPTTHMRFDVGGAPVGLSESIALEQASLCFKCPDKNALMALVTRHDLPHKKYPGYEGAFVALTAPEGTQLYAFEEDFLGESIVVDEDVDPDEFPT